MAPARAPLRTFPSRAAAPLIMASDTTSLSLSARAPEGSRSARRLRREGLVPGVIYGEGGDPQHFAVDARILRNTLAHSGAILEVSVDGGTGVPVLVKDLQRHPVRGEAVHVDLLRVNMAETIHTTVVLELTGAEEADRKSTRLNSSHPSISYAVFCLKKKNIKRLISTGLRQFHRAHNTTVRCD